MKFVPVLAALGAVSLIIIVLAGNTATGRGQALERARVPMVAADSATYSPAPRTPSPSPSPSATRSPSASATPSPSASPSPSPSPSPSASPSPTPTTDGCLQDLCLRNVSTYEAGGRWHIVGEVFNKGQGSMARASDVFLRATWYDASGSLATETIWTALRVIPGANDEPLTGGLNYSPFHVSVNAPQGKTYTVIGVVIESATVPAGEDIVRQLQWTKTVITEVRGATYFAAGMVDNGSTCAYEEVEVIAEIYDAQGKLARVASAPVSPSTVEKGTTATFSLTELDPPGGSYSVFWWVDGKREQSC